MLPTSFIMKEGSFWDEDVCNFQFVKVEHSMCWLLGVWCSGEAKHTTLTTSKLSSTSWWRVRRERERDLFFKVFKLKLDLPFFRDLFLSILHQNEARVGGIFFHHKSITSLNIASNTVMMDLVLCSTQLVSWLEFPQEMCIFIGVVRYPAIFLCFQINF